MADYLKSFKQLLAILQLVFAAVVLAFLQQEASSHHWLLDLRKCIVTVNFVLGLATLAVAYTDGDIAQLAMIWLVKASFLVTLFYRFLVDVQLNIGSKTTTSFNLDRSYDLLLGANHLTIAFLLGIVILHPTRKYLEFPSWLREAAFAILLVSLAVAAYFSATVSINIGRDSEYQIEWSEADGKPELCSDVDCNLTSNGNRLPCMIYACWGAMNSTCMPSLLQDLALMLPQHVRVDLSTAGLASALAFVMALSHIALAMAAHYVKDTPKCFHSAGRPNKPEKVNYCAGNGAPEQTDESCEEYYKNLSKLFENGMAAFSVVFVHASVRGCAAVLSHDWFHLVTVTTQSEKVCTELAAELRDIQHKCIGNVVCTILVFTAAVTYLWTHDPLQTEHDRPKNR